MTADWTLEARVDNVGDRDYTLVHGFNTAGRSAHLGLRWQPAPQSHNPLGRRPAAGSISTISRSSSISTPTREARSSAC